MKADKEMRQGFKRKNLLHQQVSFTGKIMTLHFFSFGAGYCSFFYCDLKMKNQHNIDHLSIAQPSIANHVSRSLILPAEQFNV